MHSGCVQELATRLGAVPVTQEGNVGAGPPPGPPVVPLRLHLSFTGSVDFAVVMPGLPPGQVFTFLSE